MLYLQAKHEWKQFTTQSRCYDALRQNFVDGTHTYEKSPFHLNEVLYKSCTL